MSFVGLNPTGPKSYVLKNLKVFDQRGFKSKKLIVFKDCIYYGNIHDTIIHKGVYHFIDNFTKRREKGCKTIARSVWGCVVTNILREQFSAI